MLNELARRGAPRMALHRALTVLTLVTRALSLARVTAPPASGHGSNGGLGRAHRYLIVSSLGPDRHFGSGVREVAMIMDLQAAGFGVDVLVLDAGDPKVPNAFRFGWSQVPAAKHAFEQVRRFDVAVEPDLESYSSILYFGWLFEAFGERTVKLGQKYLPLLGKYRHKTALMLDDMPQVRCDSEVKSWGADKCSKVPKLVRTWMDIASRVLTLTPEDAESMQSLMRHHGMPELPTGVWPLSISRLANLREKRSSGSYARRPRSVKTSSSHPEYLTMVANYHPTNVHFLTNLLTSPAFKRVCSQSKLTFVLVGSIQDFVEKFLARQPELTPCVKALGIVSDKVLMEDVMPKTRAILNPFFEDVGSGISVKSYESIADGTPLVTSEYGIRGLDDCIPPEMLIGKQQAADPEAYMHFVETNILDPIGYRNFESRSKGVRDACVRKQLSERMFNVTRLRVTEASPPRRKKIN